MEDLLKTVLPVHTLLAVSSMSLPFDSVQRTSLMSRLHQQSYVKFSQLVKKNRSDIAYIVPKYVYARLFFGMPYRILPGVSINAISAPFRLNKPSSYERVFGIAFMRAMGAGAVDKVLRDSKLFEESYIRIYGGRPLMEAGPQPFSLGTLGVLFAVWFFGCALSVVSFIVEICLHCAIIVNSSSLPAREEKVIYLRN